MTLPGSPQPSTSDATTAYTAAPPNRSPLGLVSFIAGVVNVLLGSVLSFAVSATIISAAGDYTAVGVLQVAHSAVSVLLALVAIVTGVIVLLKRGAPKGFAAAGTALGAAELFGLLVSFGHAAFYQLF